MIPRFADILGFSMPLLIPTLWESAVEMCHSHSICGREMIVGTSIDKRWMSIILERVITCWVFALLFILRSNRRPMIDLEKYFSTYASILIVYSATYWRLNSVYSYSYEYAFLEDELTAIVNGYRYLGLWGKWLRSWRECLSMCKPRKRTFIHSWHCKTR